MSNWKRAISFLLTLSLVVGMIPPMAPAARAEEAPTETVETVEKTEQISPAPVAEEPEPTEQQGHASEEPPAPLKASGAYNENGYAYNVDAETGTAIIVDYTGSETELTIPATLGGYPVSTIGENAFYNCDDLTKVVIPSGVTIIDDYAFEYCYALSEIVIPGSVTTIGRYAFNCCYDLAEIVIPDSVTSIGRCALAGCDALTSVVLPSGLVTLPEYLFQDCDALTSVVIPDSVTSLGEGVFYYCDALQDVTLPSGLESIPDSLFSSCEALTSIVIPEGVTTIGRNAFFRCYTLTDVQIPATVTTIEDYAFSECKALKEIALPDSLTFIGSSAFDTCSALEAIVIPDSVTIIEEDAFESCTKLASVTLSSNLESLPDSLFAHCDALTSIVIPEGVITIGDSVFSSCDSLTSVEIPNTVTTIGVCAFYTCSALEKIVIPDSVTSIDSDAFSYCDALTDVTLSSGLTSLPDDLFYDCDALERIVVPEGVTTIGDRAFAYCDSLTDVVLPNSVTTLGINMFSGCKALEEIVLPDSITSIGNGAFNGCSALTSVVLPAQLTVLEYYFFNECTSLPTVQIPATVTTIGYDAFSNCDALTEIVIPDSVTSIGNSAFYHCDTLSNVQLSANLTAISDSMFSNCKALETVVIPESVTSLDRYAFYYCTALTEIVIPDGVTTIGESAFYYCTSLTDVTLPAALTGISASMLRDCTVLETVILPENITSIGSSAFYRCTALKEIVIPDSVTTIGGDAFAYCETLTSVKLPASLTKIGTYAFNQCVALTDVEIPEGVTEIGGNAFNSCESLPAIVIPDSVTSLGSSAFQNCYALESVELSANLTAIWGYTFEDCRALKQIVIPEGVTQIGSYAFAYCDALTEAVIADSVTTIGDRAFMECPALERVVMPAGLTAIAENTFYGCSSLKDITIPEGVTKIGNYAFSGCASLPEMVIPEGVTTIEYHAFYECESLASVTIPDSVTSIGSAAFSRCSSLTEVILPKNLTAIEASMFEGCTSLARVEIPEGVRTIGSSAFADCAALTDVTLPYGLTVLESSLFSGCASLEYLEIPENVTEIGHSAFYGCTSLKNVTIPDRVTEIQTSAFRNCDAMTEIWVPDSVTFIDRYAFENCDALVTLRLSESLQSIPEGLAMNCKNLRSVTLPDSVTYINSYAFCECDALTEIAIPTGVTYIEKYAFSSCDTLRAVFMPDTINSMDSYVFNNSPNVTIYGVPGSYAETYAKDRGIPFVDMASAVRISLVVNDPEGNPISSGYRVEWYTDGELRGTGNTLYGADSEKTHSYQVILEEELVSLYYQPELTEVTLDGENLTLTCTLEPIQTISLTGTLTDEEGQPLAGTVRIRQKFSDTVSKEITVSAQTDGSFTAEIAAVAVVITVSAEGYRNRNLELDLTGNTQPCNLGEQALAKLPTNKITLKLVQTNAAYPGETPSTTTITSFDNLVFTLENVTRGTAITDFTAQYPYLLPAEAQAGGNDVVRITATNTENGTVSEAVTITLDAQATGSGELRFLENGSFVIDELTGNTQHQVMIFDAEGNFISAATASYNYYSDSLPQGSYQVVVMTKTDLLRKVSSLSVLTTYGLEAGTDYAKLDVSVENGVINRIDSLQVPVLDEGRLYYTEEDVTFFSASANSTFAGKYVVFRVAYEIKNSYHTANETVTIEIPEGLSVADGSVTVDGKIAAYALQGNHLQVNVNNPKGIVRFYLFGGDVGKFDIHANLHFTLDGSTVTQPLGTVDLELFAATWAMPEKTPRSQFTISGKAIPNSTLTIYDGDTVIGTATSNGAGTWKTEITLDNPFDYCYHSIIVSAYSEAIGKSLTSEPQTLIYDKDTIIVSKVTLYPGANRDPVEFDFINPGPTPTYVYSADGGDSVSFTYVAELTEGDPASVAKVYVITTDPTCFRTYVECFYDSSKDLWVGTHLYGPKEVPVGIEAEVIRTADREIVLDNDLIEELERIEAEAEAIAEAEERAELEALEKDVEENYISPDYDAMTDEELLALLSHILLNLKVQKQKAEAPSYIPEGGVEIETDGNSTTITSEGSKSTITVEPVDGETPESLQSKGYQKVITDEGKEFYIKTEVPQNAGDSGNGGNNPDGGNTDGGNTDGGNTDGGNTDGGNTEGGNTGGGNTDGGNTGGGSTGGDNTGGGNTGGGNTGGGNTGGGNTDGGTSGNNEVKTEIVDLGKNIKTSLAGTAKDNALTGADLTQKVLEDYLTKEHKRLADLYIEVWKEKLELEKLRDQFADKLDHLKKVGAPEDEIQLVEKSLAECKEAIKEAKNLRDEIGEKRHSTGKCKTFMKLLGKGLGLADLILKYKELEKGIEDCEKLKKMYGQIKGSCNGNDAYEELGKKINTLSNHMLMANGAFTVLSAAQLCGRVTPAGLAASMSLAVAIEAIDRAVDGVLESDYKNAENAVKTMDCNGDGKPDYVDSSAGSMDKQGANKIRLPLNPWIDPSGYVYEAVPSNRVEGVKAEVYYLGYALDEFGVPKEEPEDILWDAENYDQVNPQYTDKDGRYQWDVPVGQWLVKYSKEGYYDTDSRNDPAANEAGYLPVPPPQVEVNTAIVSKAAPTVESVNAYSDEIQIIFSQYMDLDTVTANTVTVTCGAQTVSGAVQPVNAEFNYEGTEQFASIFRFVPDSTLSGQATIAISGVVNYAGTAMSGDYKQTKSVMPKPRTIAVAESVTLDYNGQKNVEIQVLPIEAGANKTLTIEVMASAIVSAATQTVTTNSEGKATVTLNGELPGSSEIRISLDGTNLTKTITAMVTLDAMMSNTCARVEASIASGSIVTPGTLLTLTTATEGAAIYYTLDGTCPCVVDSPSRMLYTGPIAIEEDMFLIAYAVKDGLEDSKTAGFTYTVCAHTFGDWEIITEATEEEDGLRKHTCTKCGTVETEIIPFDTHTPGDINNDGKVNNKDLTRLFQYLSNWDVEVVKEALDINGDGKVNNKDLTRLFQYLSNWDVVIN